MVEDVHLRVERVFLRERGRIVVDERALLFLFRRKLVEVLPRFANEEVPQILGNAQSVRAVRHGRVVRSAFPFEVCLLRVELYGVERKAAAFKARDERHAFPVNVGGQRLENFVQAERREVLRCEAKSMSVVRDGFSSKRSLQIFRKFAEHPALAIVGGEVERQCQVRGVAAPQYEFVDGEASEILEAQTSAPDREVRAFLIRLHSEVEKNFRGPLVPRASQVSLTTRKEYPVHRVEYSLVIFIRLIYEYRDHSATGRLNELHVGGCDVGPVTGRIVHIAVQVLGHDSYDRSIRGQGSLRCT